MGDFALRPAAFDRRKAVFRSRKMVFGRRKTIFDPRKTIFKAPEAVFDPPKTVFGRQKMVFDPPETVLATPETIFDPPKTIFGQPKTIFNPPKAVLNARETIFVAPEAVFAERSGTFAPRAPNFCAPAAVFDDRVAISPNRVRIWPLAPTQFPFAALVTLALQSASTSPMPFARRASRLTAFTLVEFLTVIAIMGILAGITVGVISGTRSRAAINRAKSELAALAAALEDYKRHYGDYPQLGDLNQAPIAPASSTTGPGTNTAQARLFNCLTGVFGPARFTSDDRLAGPMFLEPGRFTLNGTLQNNFQQVTAQPPKPPFKTEQNVSLLDPWGHPYFYYYKRASNPSAWRASAYVLYSAGPDGAQTLPINQASGIFNTTQPTNNADNLYAQLP